MRDVVAGLGLRRYDNPHKTAAVDGPLERHRPPAAGTPLDLGLLCTLGKEGVTGAFDGCLPLVLVHALLFCLIIRRLKVGLQLGRLVRDAKRLVRALGAAFAVALETRATPQMLAVRRTVRADVERPGLLRRLSLGRGLRDACVG